MDEDNYTADFTEVFKNIKEESFTLDDQLFLRLRNILSEEERQEMLRDADWQLKVNYCSQVPPHQTNDNLHELEFFYRHESWKKLYGVIRRKIHSNLKLNSVWINLSKEDNRYEFHCHPETDITAVYYLQNRFPEYGTMLEKTGVNIMGFENSILFMNTKIFHSITNMPPILAKDNHRYSIAFDFVED